MRRTASQVIQELQMRVARLEKSAMYFPTEVEIPSDKIEKAMKVEWSASEFYNEYKRGSHVNDTLFRIGGEKIYGSDAVKKYMGKYPSIVQALQMAKSNGSYAPSTMTVINVHGRQRHHTRIISDWDFIINGKHYTGAEATEKFGRMKECLRGILEAQEHKVFEGVPFKIELERRGGGSFGYDPDRYEG